MLFRSQLSVFTLTVILATILTASPFALAGDLRTVVSEAVYVMADRDTLASAWQAALLRAKQKAIEQAGMYVESWFTDASRETATDSRQTSSLVIRTIAAAITETEILDQESSITEGRPSFYVKIRAVVDRTHLADAVRRLQLEDRFAGHLQQLKTENSSLKAELSKLTHELEDYRNNRSPVRIETPDELVQRAFKTSRLSEKVLLATQAINMNRQLAEAYVVRGQTYLKAASATKTRHGPDADFDLFIRMASGDFSRALAIDPYQTWALLGRAEVHGLQGNFAESLSDYRQLLDIDPLFDLARQRMTVLAIRTAKQHIAARRWSDASAILDGLLGGDPLPSWVPYQAEAYLLRSRVRRALHRQKDALEDLNTLLAALPLHAEALRQRGQLHETLGLTGEAISDFEQACALGLKAACRSSS
ncbi:MAG TPA: hypothetical protein VLA99_02375 [Nitrospiraceae bacterium]|nr:hypothetical protein [Nitrospiraceae bacterium]